MSSQATTDSNSTPSGPVERFFGGVFSGIVAVFGWLGRSHIWKFWLKQVLLARVLTIVLFTLVTYNPWGYSYQAWAKGYLRSCPSFDFGDPRFVGFSIVTLLVGGLWSYLIVKAWQGVGERWYKFMIPAGITVLLVMFIVQLGYVADSGNYFKLLVTVAFGALIGVCFSLTLIDRHLSATGTAFVAHGEIDHHSAPTVEHH